MTIQPRELLNRRTTALTLVAGGDRLTTRHPDGRRKQPWAEESCAASGRRPYNPHSRAPPTAAQFNGPYPLAGTTVSISDSCRARIEPYTWRSRRLTHDHLEWLGFPCCDVCLRLLAVRLEPRPIGTNTSGRSEYLFLWLPSFRGRLVATWQAERQGLWSTRQLGKNWSLSPTMHSSSSGCIGGVQSWEPSGWFSWSWT
jgi:hypothetical protein